jgi:hypothetical protein
MCWELDITRYCTSNDMEFGHSAVYGVPQEIGGVEGGLLVLQRLV